MDDEEFSGFMDRLASAPSNTRAEVVKKAAGSGERTLVERIAEELERPFSPYRSAAAFALVHLESGHAAALIALSLSHANIAVRLAVLNAARQFAEEIWRHGPARRGWLDLPRDQRLIPVATGQIIRALMRMTEDEDRDVRLEAAAALQAIQNIVAQWRASLVRDARGYEEEDDDDDDDEGGGGGWSGSVRPPTVAGPSPIEREIAYAARRVAADEGLDGSRVEVTLYSDDDGTSAEELAEGEAIQVARSYWMRVALRHQPAGIAHVGVQEPIRPVHAAKTVEIIVSADSDDFAIEEPVQTLDLAPDGQSTRDAWFQIRTTRDAGATAQIGLTLYYQLNLLETIVLTAPIVGRFDHPRAGPTRPVISIQQRQSSHRYERLEQLSPRHMHIAVERRGPHYALKFTVRSERTHMVLSGVGRLQASDIEDELVRVREDWNRMATSGGYRERIAGTSDEYVENVRVLADIGSRLWTRLFRHESAGSLAIIGDWLIANPLPPGAVVQVSTAPDAQDFLFPWAMLFDRKVPVPRYELPDIEGFWGVRYCIEQRLSPSHPPTPEAPHDGRRLGFFRCNRLKHAAEQDRLLQRLQAESRGSLTVSRPPLEDADKCYGVLQGCDADLLYFYAHGFTRSRRLGGSGQGDADAERYLTFVRSIQATSEPESPLRSAADQALDEAARGTLRFDSSWIELSYGRLYLNKLYQEVTRLPSQPVVVLNLCESGQITPYLAESFVHFFLSRGARSVIGTECSMSAEFAHHFSGELLERVLQGTNIGEALRLSRISFMQQNRNPLGLAYTLFGLSTAELN
jgi:hypothetical protein